MSCSYLTQLPRMFLSISLLLSGQVLSIRERDYAPQNFRNGQQDIGWKKFEGTYSWSQTLCKEQYRSWWDSLLPQRLGNARIRSWARKGFMLPEPVLYEVAPVQSIRSVYTGDELPELVYVGEGRWTKYTECATLCEDVRSQIEIWFTFIIERATQVRYKGPGVMACAPGTYAYILEAPDEREEETPLREHLFQKVLDYKEYTWTLPREAPGRFDKRNGMVDQCHCLSEVSIEEEEVVSEMQCVDSVPVNSITSDVFLRSYQQPVDHTASDEEYVKMWEVWMDTVDFSGSASQHAFRTAGPVKEVRYPGRLIPGSTIRGCAHVDSKYGSHGSVRPAYLQMMSLYDHGSP